MKILVDYDNIDRAFRAKGLFFIVATIADAIGPDHLSDGELLEFRLYGGWYEGSRMTRPAQALSAHAQQEFPAALGVSRKGRSAKLRARMELAQSLLIDPLNVLPNTYRKRGMPENLDFASLPVQRCVDQEDCALVGAQLLFRDGVCSQTSCPVRLGDVLSRPEQKLVDTMLSADLIHLATSDKRGIGIVTSDDDMWPAIKTALKLGAKVLHVHPLVGRSTPKHYSAGAGSGYSERSF